MEKGSLVEFQTNGEPRLGVVDRADGKKNWIVFDQNDRGQSMHPRQITYEFSGGPYDASDIPRMLAQIEPLLDPAQLSVAWELLSEMGETTNPKELAEILFSDQSPKHCYAAHRLLDKDRMFFKQKGDRYEPRPSSQVAELQHQIAVTQQKQRDWENFIDRLREATRGESEVPIEWPSLERSRLEALERFATFGDEAQNRTMAQEILAALGLPQTPQEAFNVLVRLNLWSPHENLFLRRSQAPVGFSAPVQNLAQALLTQAPPDPAQRLDLTHLKVYTIDDEATQEIDDGLSMETLANGRQRIWVHIADPTRWVTPGDPLDLEARRRATTIYLPTGMVPMFPPVLATGPMSLVQGQVCCALSFAVLLDESGGVEEFTIHTSLIKTTYRLTYDDVDEMLQLGVTAEPELAQLEHWARQRRSWRQSQGAIFIHMPETSIKVNGSSDDIQISVLEKSFSRELVAEMMILVGEVAARYAQEHSLPVLFRTQMQPELPSEEELLLVPAGPARSVAIRRCMPKSEVGLTPGRHASLGLDFYTQVTSPIRRYSDMLAHFQIKAHLLGGTVALGVPQVQEIILSLTGAVQEAIFIERQTNRYWILEYLRRNPSEYWSGLMLRWLREHEGLGVVMLEDIGVELVMTFDRGVQPGDRLTIWVNHVDPRQDVIHLSVVENSDAQQGFP
jgi:exoribonuclease II